DCLLLGPQVKYLLDETNKKYSHIPVMSINTVDYGRMDGEKVLKSAIALYKESNK
ncbi:MAG: PTS sugar transporter subunit IIB, partial [Peptostreptococcaceae bacterium]